ncbi:hypothetical protein ACQP1O_20585 [Nocardia sp. CA-151230]|uniref:hypothetical protein n=1 Tax=Nocardia sp. CA-151230 TaxID=3239982 RepID=UPI003D9396B0
MRRDRIGGRDRVAYQRLRCASDSFQLAALLIEQTRVLLDIPAGDDTALTALALLITSGAAELIVVWLDGGLPVERPVLIRIVADHVVEMVGRLPGMTSS